MEFFKSGVHHDVKLNIASAHLYRFSLPLIKSIQLGPAEINRREGLILVLTDISGKTGFGEISPLPGFSKDTLEEATYKTVSLLDNMVQSSDFVSQQLAWDIDLDKLDAPSIVNFGVRTALHSLIAQIKGVTLGTLLIGESSNHISINGLINSDFSNWVQDAQRLVASGYSTIKIKVGRLNPELEALGVQSIRQVIGPDIKLRLDANRSWDLETAIKFGKNLDHIGIEYIEEPLNKPEDLPLFYHACGMHFALDETLHHIMDPTISFNSYTGLAALVLKPTLIACMSRLLSLIDQAKNQNILAVLSSSYESDIGLTLLAQLAGSISGEEIAVGLDTASIFQNRIIKTPVPIENGRMQVDSLSLDDIDLSHCELLYEK
jgi:O-succinylbenzoate synthase